MGRHSETFPPFVPHEQQIQAAHVTTNSRFNVKHNTTKYGLLALRGAQLPLWRRHWTMQHRLLNGVGPGNSLLARFQDATEKGAHGKWVRSWKAQDRMPCLAAVTTGKLSS
jgi:hypothetical protein